VYGLYGKHPTGSVKKRRLRVAGDRNGEKDHFTRITATLALLVSLATLAFTMYWNSPFGYVGSVEPSGYAVARGYHFEIEGRELAAAPSDHIVLPLEWQNNSGSSVLIKNPELVLYELDEAGNDVGDPQHLFFIGDYPELSGQALASRNTDPHSYKSSLVLAPHSVSESVSVFRIKKWLGDNYLFRLKGDTDYRLEIEYDQIPTIEIRLIPKGLHWGFVHIAGEERQNDGLMELSTSKDINCLRLPEGLPERITRLPSVVNPPEDVLSPDPCEGFAPGYDWDYWSSIPGARE
jgi:hypothetical protein